MAKHRFIICALLCSISLFLSTEGFSFFKSQMEIIKSLVNDLNVKHVMIIMQHSPEFPVDFLTVIKNYSREHVYASLLTSIQLNSSMFRDYYHIPWKKGGKNIPDLLLKMQMNVAPPKTIVTHLQNEDLKKTLKTVFTENHEFGLSRYLWLVFDTFNDSVIIDLKESYIPYDVECVVIRNSLLIERGYELYKIYHTRIHGGIYREFLFGRWTEEKFERSEVEFYQTRFDMNGTVMAYGYDSPDDEECWRETCPFYEFLNETSRMMNIQWAPLFNFYDYHDYFDLDRHLFHDLTLELYIGRLSITSGNPFGQWIGPFWKKPSCLYIPLDQSYIEHGISPYSRPFTFHFWLMVIGWVTLTGTFLVAIDFIKNKFNSKPFSIIRCMYAFYYTFEILVNQIGDEFSTNLHFQVISLSAQIIALFVVPAYTGDILSFILVQNIELPFQGIEGFVRDGSYELLTHFDFQSLRLAGKDTWLYKAFNLLHEDNYNMGDTPDMLSFMCRNHKFVYFTFEDPNILEFEECQILRIQNPVFIAWDVILTRRDSPYKKIFSRITKTMGSNGMLSKLRRQVFENFVHQKAESDDFEAVNFESCLPLIGVVGVLYTSSIMLLMLEYFLKRRKGLKVSLFLKKLKN